MFDFIVGRVEKLAAPVGEYQPFFTPGKQLFSLWTDAAHPYQLVELDPASGAIIRSVLAVGDPLPGKSYKSVSFPSSDGIMIQGWLCLPEGKGPFPTILETHGGPTAVQGSGFNPGAQAWVDHGFAFLSINYHGSVTFGREFEQSIWGNLGHWELEDMVMAQKWLVEQRIADPGAIFLTGWSYGGYLTLFGLGKRPDLWAGGMAGIAIADWAMMYDDSADTLRGYEEALFGCKPSEDPERFHRSSPITYAENVRAPLLIIQGRNDTRTPARPMQAYEAKMKELGKDVTVHWFDTGHIGSFADVELGISHQEMMMSFARKVLGG
jgi:dipeptidyl aminopeptidase/acylaminoacyl peptidase